MKQIKIFTLSLLFFFAANATTFAQSKVETDKIFAGLSAGGKITMPLANTFWGDYFGMCEDKFGINWMFSYNEQGKVA